MRLLNFNLKFQAIQPMQWATVNYKKKEENFLDIQQKSKWKTDGELHGTLKEDVAQVDSLIF